jgi:hypothetical protein
MAGGQGKSNAPTTVAEGLGDVLNAIVRCQQAPDAVHYAGPLLKLQTTVLDLVHGPGKGGQSGGAPPPGGGAGAGPPPGGGAPPGGGGSPLMGGLAGLQGAAQGPSAATSGGGPSLSGMDPEEMRQKALIGGDQ